MNKQCKKNTEVKLASGYDQDSNFSMDWDSKDKKEAMKLVKQRCTFFFSTKDIDDPEKQVSHILLKSGTTRLHSGEMQTSA